MILLLVGWGIRETRFAFVAIPTSGTVVRWQPRETFVGRLLGLGTAEVQVQAENAPRFRTVSTYWRYKPAIGDELPVLVDPRSASPGNIERFSQNQLVRWAPAAILLLFLAPTVLPRQGARCKEEPTLEPER